MKYISFFISLAITLALTLALNTKLGVAPAFGKFLNPFGGFWQNAENNQRWKDGEENLQGLKEPVQVYFDDRLVPHVFAKNDADLYFMQGYITAKYRLWQMEIQTHDAAGRLSEIAGEKTLEKDKLTRRIGMPWSAEAAEEYIKKDEFSRNLIEAYCKGVNAYIQQLSPKDYPFEYKLLNYEPEEWKPIKVALLLKNMANMLSVYEYDIENANFISKFGEAEYRKLYPDWVQDEEPIVPSGTPWVQPLSAKELSTSEHRTSLSAMAHITKPDEITGSNNWAVSGSKTKSGKPILCNDPHLKLSLPAIWYEMHLVSPNMNVYGATLPGSPAVISGFNDSIAWGVTNAGRDVRDWYTIQFKDDSRNEYQYNGQWVKSEKRIEKHYVRGKGVVEDEVIYTRFGPVVFDKNFGQASSTQNLAMKWTAHIPSNEFKTFYLFNCGKNYDDYIEALNHYTCPAQNFVFASRSGDIAIKEQGRFPIRNKATEQGKFLSQGNSAVDEWVDFIPNEANPTSKNPARGFVSSANQHPTDSTYPYYYPGVGVYENYRNRVINQLLADNNAIDADFMKKMQDNNFNLQAKEALPVMLSLLDSTKINSAFYLVLEQLRQWDCYNNPNSLAASYYEQWWTTLYDWLWDEMSDPLYPMKKPGAYMTLKTLQNDTASQFFDVKATRPKENIHDCVTLTFNLMVEDLTAKYGSLESVPVWSLFKDTRVEHLSQQPALSALHVMNGGNRGIINATNSTHGPSWRMIVDFGDMKGYVVYPGGQSGNPGSAYYTNMVDTWAKGAYYTANFIKTPEELGGKKLFATTYKP
ncbi:MAG: penicillin acylase family protein [Bacteroidetes bacterium]|nr:penicillin acylase family protein [Bacteroidota bacterium]